MTIGELAMRIAALRRSRALCGSVIYNATDVHQTRTGARLPRHLRAKSSEIPAQMNPSVQAFSNWLSATPLSMQIQTVSWIIPTVQTIHILAIAIVISSAAMLDLRVLGVLFRGQPLDAVARRFVPWIWWTLLVLLLTGATLIVGEPERSLANPAFILKMSLLAAVLLVTVAFQKGFARGDVFWDSTAGRRVAGRLLAGLSLVLWIGIVFAGRWIAYIDLGA